MMVAESKNWLSTPEKGSVLALRLIVFLGTVGGRRLARFLVKFVALYFIVRYRALRRASADYYTRLEGRVPGGKEVYRHVLRFAEVAVDRFFLIRRRFDLFTFSENGKENLMRLKAEGRGALLIGAHLGSFEAMRVLSAEADLPLSIVGYFKNARVFNAALEKMDPTSNVTLIEIDPKSMSFVFRVKQRIERGELVAVLADRVGLSGSSAVVNFLGAPARFPTGVFSLASVLACPVYFTAGLYRHPSHYDLFCQPFADRIELPRGDRDTALQKYTQQYADIVADYCHRAPDNWFNFYDFWASAK
jgi:predicted LPLAT superfamily acyltransferase